MLYALGRWLGYNCKIKADQRTVHVSSDVSNASKDLNWSERYLCLEFKSGSSFLKILSLAAKYWTKRICGMGWGEEVIQREQNEKIELV